MKKLQKGALALAIILGAASFANAQMFRVGIHATGSMPMGEFADQPSSDAPHSLGATFGIGGNISGDYYFNENVHAGLEVGYRTYGTEYDDLGVTGTVNIIPIQLTGAYHLGAEDALDVYFGTGVGVFMVDRSMDDPDLDDFVSSDSEMLIGFSPRIGVSYELSSELRLDANVAYTYLLGNEDIETETENVGGVEFESEVATGYPTLSMVNVNLGITYTLWD